jgi:hypothetical protein
MVPFVWYTPTKAVTEFFIVSTVPTSRLATCLSSSSYPEALTRGKKYPILAHDGEKHQIRICGDNQRSRWYPAICFDLTGNDCPMITAITLDDPIQDPQHDCIEVTITLSGGKKRWCICVTPSWLADALRNASAPKHLDIHGVPIVQYTFLADYGTARDGSFFGVVHVPHMLTFSTLSEPVIAAALEQIINKNELHACTRSLTDEE